ncbi:protein rep [Nostocales cyanobacterium LEGE 11386]|nr:protein rep [Nostocales cyanobacterium LEGE 11386]
MSTPALHGNFIPVDLSPKKYSKGQDVPSLAEIAPTGKIWDKHRANVDQIAYYYATSGEDNFLEYAWRMRMCSELLEFRLVPEETEGIFELKLSNARFCRVRHCPVCQWRRALMWKARAYKTIPQVVADYPKYRWLFITLTVKNCQIKQLRESLDEINKAFKRLTELKAWPAKGWIKSIEVTKGKDGISAHPHLHILAMVQPSYFSHGYISHTKWVALWQKCLRIDYQPVLHVSAIAKHHDPKQLIPEILKYQVKESDLVSGKEWFLELTRQMHQTRAIAVGGILRHYMRELEEENQDLIGDREEIDEVDKRSLFVKWERKLQRFKIMSDT